jgi:hypothetical protein
MVATRRKLSGNLLSGGVQRSCNCSCPPAWYPSLIVRCQAFAFFLCRVFASKLGQQLLPAGASAAVSFIVVPLNFPGQADNNALFLQIP